MRKPNSSNGLDKMEFWHDQPTIVVQPEHSSGVGPYVTNPYVVACEIWIAIREEKPFNFAYLTKAKLQWKRDKTELQPNLIPARSRQNMLKYFDYIFQMPYLINGNFCAFG